MIHNSCNSTRHVQITTNLGEWIYFLRRPCSYFVCFDRRKGACAAWTLRVLDFYSCLSGQESEFSKKINFALYLGVISNLGHFFKHVVFFWWLKCSLWWQHYLFAWCQLMFREGIWDKQSSCESNIWQLSPFVKYGTYWKQSFSSISIPWPVDSKDFSLRRGGLMIQKSKRGTVCAGSCFNSLSHPMNFLLNSTLYNPNELVWFYLWCAKYDRASEWSLGF